MTGMELINFIKENHLEDYEIRVYDHFGDDAFLFSDPEVDYIKKEIWLVE